MSGLLNKPSQVRIGAKMFRITWDQESWDGILLAGSMNDHDKGVGFSDSEVSRIHIKPGQSLGEEQDTLVHEILHMIWSQVPAGDAMDEEFIVSGFSPWLLLVLQDNPSVISYLTVKDEGNG